MSDISYIQSENLRKLYAQFLRRKAHCKPHDGTWWKLDKDKNAILMNYRPLKTARKFHYSGAKNRAFGGGYGDGKSLAICQESIILAHEYPGCVGLIGCATYPQLRDTTRKTFLDVCPPELIAKFNKTENNLYFHNGSEIRFRALTAMSEEDLVKFKNMNIGFVVFDQAESVDEEIFELCCDRLRQVNSPRCSIIAFNMEGHNWIWKKWVKEVQEGRRDPKEFELFVAKSIENPYLPEDYVFHLLADYPEEWVERFVLGSFSTFKGKIFKDFDEDKDVVEEFEPPMGWTRYRSIDWGMLNPCGVLWCAVDEQGTRWYYGESYEKGVTVPGQAAIIRSSRYNMYRDEGGRINPYSFLWTTIDPTTNRPDAATGTTIKQMFDENGVYTSDANNDVNAGIEKIAQGLRAGKIKIMRNCLNLIDEISNYRWQHKRDTGSEKPQKVRDHLVDAMRYLEMSDPVYRNPIEDYSDEETEAYFTNPATGY